MHDGLALLACATMQDQKMLHAASFGTAVCGCMMVLHGLLGLTIGLHEVLAWLAWIDKT